MTTSDAAGYFAAKLAFETDPSDVHSALEDGTAEFELVDTRSLEAWRQGHARAAVHIPQADLVARVPSEFPRGTRFVVYCWGPGCNGATRSALILATLGFDVKEMLGGFEYWAREGLPVDGPDGDLTRAPDPLTATVPTGGGRIACDC
jgi:rhodanese-related sulfurtransferase